MISDRNQAEQSLFFKSFTPAIFQTVSVITSSEMTSRILWWTSVYLFIRWLSMHLWLMTVWWILHVGRKTANVAHRVSLEQELKGLLQSVQGNPQRDKWFTHDGAHRLPPWSDSYRMPYNTIYWLWWTWTFNITFYRHSECKATLGSNVNIMRLDGYYHNLYFVTYNNLSIYLIYICV